MVCVQHTPFMNKIEELLSFYEDEESLKILWAHFTMLFELSNLPEALKTVSIQELCVRPQYFLEDGKYLNKQRVMIDCGAYVGDTLDDVYAEGNVSFIKILCFGTIRCAMRK